MKLEKLYCFDFDGTFFNTPEEINGRKIWKDQTGTEFPHVGWWSKVETINPDVFYIPVNKWVLNKYLECIDDPKSYSILATGRLNKVPGMREGVERILSENDIKFDEVHLNTGGDTLTFKIKLLERLISKLGVIELIMFDDRYEHLVEFKKWATTQKIKITIVDVVKKETTIIEND